MRTYVRNVDRRLRLAVVAVTLALMCGCGGGKPAVAPAPTGAPKYPDYVFPSAPTNAGAPTLALSQNEAWQILQSGDTHNAERAFAAILKIDPGFYPAQAGLGYTALARKDAQGAVSDFDRALAGNAQYAPALAGKGDALLSLGRSDAALQTFQQALVADPGLAALKSRVDVLKFRTVQQEIADARKAAESNNLADARQKYQAAITASPDSAFLYRELADVDRRAGDTASALAQAQQAAKLDPTDAHALELEGQIHEARGEWSDAADAYAAAGAIEPSDALTAKVDAMREKASLATMPAEFQSIDGSATITRAQLAALIAVRLPDLVHEAAAANPVVVTDAQGNWALPWIIEVTRGRIMEVLPNHTFEPSATVSRGDLARAASRLLEVVGAQKPKIAARWRDQRPTFTDLAQTNLSYPAVARAVAAGVLAPLPDGTFQSFRPATGADAIAAVAKVDALARK